MTGIDLSQQFRLALAVAVVRQKYLRHQDKKAKISSASSNRKVPESHGLESSLDLTAPYDTREPEREGENPLFPRTESFPAEALDERPPAATSSEGSNADDFGVTSIAVASLFPQNGTVAEQTTQSRFGIIADLIVQSVETLHPDVEDMDLESNIQAAMRMVRDAMSNAEKVAAEEVQLLRADVNNLVTALTAKLMMSSQDTEFRSRREKLTLELCTVPFIAQCFLVAASQQILLALEPLVLTDTFAGNSAQMSENAFYLYEIQETLVLGNMTSWSQNGDLNADILQDWMLCHSRLQNMTQQHIHLGPLFTIYSSRLFREISEQLRRLPSHAKHAQKTATDQQK